MSNLSEKALRPSLKKLFTNLTMQTKILSGMMLVM